MNIQILPAKSYVANGNTVTARSGHNAMQPTTRTFSAHHRQPLLDNHDSLAERVWGQFGISKKANRDAREGGRIQ